jgi:hypothetical protein
MYVYKIPRRTFDQNCQRQILSRDFNYLLFYSSATGNGTPLETKTPQLKHRSKGGQFGQPIPNSRVGLFPPGHKWRMK